MERGRREALQFVWEDSEMNARRGYSRLLTAATPAAVAAVGAADASANDDSEKACPGAWTVLSMMSNGFTFLELVNLAR
jgi:hypothetical protein